MFKKMLSFLLVLVLFFGIFVEIKATDFDLEFDAVSKQKASEVFEILNNNKTFLLSKKIELISAVFLDTPYVANRLVGSNDVAEKLVVDLLGLDCFTYLDYLEAFKTANNQEAFLNNLQRVRYIDSKVEYLKRKHFYSDWLFENQKLVIDLTKEDKKLADLASVDVVQINLGKNGEYIPNLGVREREISYIPRDNVSDANLSSIVSGDYVGFRREIAGLDVTHVGLLIKKTDGIYVRHASSAKSAKKVVDQKLVDYLAINTGVKGILLFRPKVAQLLVNYVDEFGNTLKESLVENKMLGDNYIINVPDIAGYVLTRYEGNIQGVMDRNDIVVNIVYSSNQKIDQISMTDNVKTLPKTGVNE